MKKIITQLAEHVIDLAGEIGTDAEALPDDAGIIGAEAVIHLRDAQQCLHQARDALRLTLTQRNNPKNE
jgi:hypothetical protein